MGELIDKLGDKLITEANEHIEKISTILGLRFNISVDESEWEYCVKENERIILIIDKENLFIRPYEFFRLKTLYIFDEFEHLTSQPFGETKFYDSLVQLQMKENISLFMYYYLIYVFDYFNLEAEESKLSRLKDGNIILDSAKYEWVYKDKEKKEVRYQKVLHVFRLSEKTDKIQISKIYTGHRFETISLKIGDII